MLSEQANNPETGSEDAETLTWQEKTNKGQNM